MRLFTVDEMYTPEEQSYLWAMRDYFKVETTCLECIMRLMPEPYNTEYYSTTDLDGKELNVNVKMARDLIEHYPIPQLTWSPADLARNLEDFQMQFLESHIDHIPPDRLSRPGIGLVLGRQHGQTIMIPIDGSHRAAYCLKHGKPFTMYVLPSALLPAVKMGPEHFQAIQQRLVASGFIAYVQERLGALVR